MAKYQIMEFEIVGNQYAMDIKYINGIYKASNCNIVPIPQCSEFLLGLTELRGNIFPVVDLRKKLGFNDVEITADTKFIILKIDNVDIGVVVDEVTDILKPTDENIKDASFLSFGSNEYISHIVKAEDHFVIVLEMEKLFENNEVLSFEAENLHQFA